MKLAPLAVVALLGCGRIGFGETAEIGAEFRSLCELDKVASITNGIQDDDKTGARLQQALAAGCGNAPLVRIVSQDDPGILDPVTDRPLIPADELVIIGGGEGPNRALRYLLDADATPVVWSNSPATIRERETDRLIATSPITGTHDIAMVMVIVEPVSGTRVLSGQGFQTEGTVAAGLWFEQTAATILGNRDVWTLIDWTDTDGNTGASLDDAFVILESGR